MPTLDVISVNIWSILISLCNLLILFFIIKKFLYKPVRKMLAERQAAVDKVYSEADEALRSAEQDRLTYSQKLEHADSECDALMRKSSLKSKRPPTECGAELRTFPSMLPKSCLHAALTAVSTGGSLIRR